jgi:branched-chain amino acid transport system permease protein
VNIHRQRLLAFTISGALAGFAGGLLVHQLGSITTEQVYLDLTFLTLAMLIIGGAASLFGAVLGALLISFFDSFLLDAESGADIVGIELTLPNGSSTVILGALMALVLILRPRGITKGKEVSLPRLRGRRDSNLTFDQMSGTVTGRVDER